MRLMEAIIDANHRAIAGDERAGLRPAEYGNDLPLVALTCIDPRLNPLLPEVLGVPEEQFIWLRNAGNIITGRLSSTMRSLSLACAVKGGKEIAIIGHSDCLVAKTSSMRLLEALKAVGIERERLPENLSEYFGIFSSERQNVIRGAELVRGSPLIGPKIPVHGLLVDTDTGKLEWLVNGYEAPTPTLGEKWHHAVQSAEETLDAFKNLTNFKIGDKQFSETKIGEIVTKVGDWASEKIEQVDVTPPSAPTPAPPAPPPRPAAPPVPPRIPGLPLRPRITGRQGPK